MASKVQIVNLALARLGAERISSLDENNKYARMGETFYDLMLEYLLSIYDWSFARKTVQLSEVDETHPIWEYIYELPADCARPITVLPKTSYTNWEVKRLRVYCNFTPAWLEYIQKNPSEGSFPGYFVSAFAWKLAAEMSYPIVQDKRLTKMFIDLAENKIAQAMADDANVGNIQREPDMDPNYDTFVNPDIQKNLISWDEDSCGDS